MERFFSVEANTVFEGEQFSILSNWGENQAGNATFGIRHRLTMIKIEKGVRLKGALLLQLLQLVVTEAITDILIEITSLGRSG